MQRVRLSKGSSPNWRNLRRGLFALLLLAGIGSAVQSQNPATTAPVYQVDIEGVINPGASALLQHAIDSAEAQGAAALIMRIDTPGGLLSSTRDMVASIGESRVPVIGYVGPSGAGATSAGAFILLSTHLAVMNDGTTVGASSPVAGDGSDIEGTMAKKVMNDSRALMRSIAEERGRNADLAETFVSEAVSVTAKEAREGQVIDLVIPELSELLTSADGKEIQFQGKALRLDLANREIIPVEPRLMDRLLKIIAQPQIAHLLISLGMLGIYLEFLSPGLAFPGVLGGIAMILGLIGVQSLPVNAGFMLLLFLGMALMLAEVFVAGFGVLGIGGAIAFVLGSFRLFDLPDTDEYRSSVLAISIGVSAAILLTTLLIGQSLRWRESKTAKTSLIGETGEAMVNFDHKGYVLVKDQRWPAVTTQPLGHGDRVQVTDTNDKGELLVRKVNPD